MAVGPHPPFFLISFSAWIVLEGGPIHRIYETLSLSGAPFRKTPSFSSHNKATYPPNPKEKKLPFHLGNRKMERTELKPQTITLHVYI